MPDWSYRPLLRPVLFALSANRARDLTIGVVGTLGRTRAGWWLLDRVGRLRPHPSIKRSMLGLTFRAPLGLGAGVDVHGQAVAGLSTFGLGFVEVGPITLQPVLSPAHTVQRNTQRETLRGMDLPVNAGAQVARAALARPRLTDVPVLARLAHAPQATALQQQVEIATLMHLLGPVVDAFTIDLTSDEVGAITPDDLQRLMTDAAPRPVLLAVPPDLPAEVVSRLAVLLNAAGWPGVLIKDVRSALGWQNSGPDVLPITRCILEQLRAQLKPQAVIVAGGAYTPADAHQLLSAGADLVYLRAGLVYHGPGLAQRVHDTLAMQAPPARAPRGWPWMALLGLGMILGGVLVGWVGLQFVVLPYDEMFLHLSRAGLARLNPHLLPFLTHDRLTLAGTMVSIGVLYTGLASGPLRRGHAWAWEALLCSGTLGFLSFALFLGYRYFDPLHASVSLPLLALFLLGLRDRPGSEGVGEAVDLHNDASWRWGMAGQLLWVATGAGLVLAGLTISLVGMTTVFVPQDLMFLHTTSAALHAANAHLIPLTAHDRAGFGGALASSGVGVLLSALWGYRRGARWLWWTLLLSGVPGFASALWVHFHVGYLDFWHLAPAWIGLALFLAALALSARFLLDRGPRAPTGNKKETSASLRQRPSTDSPNNPTF